MYVQWLKRGRAHRRNGQPLDALQCFRRAMRERPPQPEAAFLAGEMLWHLGQLDDAMRTWRDTAEAHPRFLPAVHALSEAAVARGDFETAAAASERILALAPDDGRAQVVRAIALYRKGGSQRDEARDALSALAAADASWLGVQALGGSVALLLDQTEDAALTGRLAAAVGSAGIAARIDARLHAHICEWAASSGRDDGWFAAMLARTLAVDEHDALRRAARAAASSALATAEPLALAYAQLCIGAFRAGVPLQWPLRTAGRPRVVFVACSDRQLRLAEHVARALASSVDVALAGLQLGAIDSKVFSRTIALAEMPGSADARAIAAFDPDALVELCGLDAPLGPMLAQRPTRLVLTLSNLETRLPTPLVDESLESEDALIARLRALPCEATSSPDLSTVDAAWHDAVTSHQAGDVERASAGYAQVLAWQPQYVPALFLTAALARERGDLEHARAALATVLASAPQYHDARTAALGVATSMRDADAVAALAAAIEPGAPASLWRAAGEAWLALHRPEQAVECFRGALERDPSHADTHYNVGVALQMMRRPDDAARSYQRALVCNPELTAAHFNLGVIFTDGGNHAAAIAAFGEVVRRDPTHVAAQKHLCEALRNAGRIDEWLAQFRRFEAACPSSLTMAVHALEACHYAGDAAAIDRYLAGLAEDRYAVESDVELVDALEELLYLLLYFDVDPSVMLRLAETYDHAATHVYGEPLPRAVTRSPGRIRIGYLSADLRNHVMGKMMYQAIARHDRSRFDIRLYSTSSVSDAWTERFIAAADAFVPLAGLDDAAAVRRVAADDLDILVDLNTHTRGARPGILARKPARLAITHVASAGTLGLRAIDFKLTDAFADVPGASAYQLEPLLVMDGCVYPYRSIPAAREHVYRRETLGIAADAVVIAAFVNPLKLSRRCLALWRDVMKQVPKGVLAFSPFDNALRGVYLRLTAAAGIEPRRIVFVPASADDAVNQARYAVVDMVLDPMPFGGVNGTLEALDAGVPVVTLAGQRHGERSTFSILSNLGVTETVATTGREYIAIAARLAHDAVFRDHVRNAIRAGVARSPLTDMDLHTRSLEAAYVRALEERAPEALAQS